MVLDGKFVLLRYFCDTCLKWRVFEKSNFQGTFALKKTEEGVMLVINKFLHFLSDGFQHEVIVLLTWVFLPRSTFLVTTHFCAHLYNHLDLFVSYIFFRLIF